ESAAGGSFDGTVGAGETVRIFTGAPVPNGADAIVIQEVTERDGDTVKILESSDAGRFVRKAGQDFTEGDVLLNAGRVLSARDLGLAAAANAAKIKVRKKPNVCILATGNEVVLPGEAIGPNQIVSSNSVMLAAFVESAGGQANNLGIARDDMASLKGLLQKAQGADLLITIGGASVGDYDLVGQALDDEGVELGFYKVAMRPGKPLIFGQLGGTAVLGLPGNPVSAGVTAEVFIRPAIDKMLGIPDDTRLQTVVLGNNLSENDQRQDYLRATLSTDTDGNAVATTFNKQDSAMLARFAKADCLVIRPPLAKAAAKGTRVDALMLTR
ncbi:MAG: molybdopterin molybdotransferase MoeA, partial [Rhodospirillaceae bacterium]|nr:molybdopterin molybdotransferase MoeA [Rhodospirillaceae bacterium]